jgi:GNAT superfamily N-acetyltransferase
MRAEKGIKPVHIEVLEHLTEEQKYSIRVLQQTVFSDVSDEEGEEDFYHPESASVLAYIDDELVGWAGVHISQVEFEGRQFLLGGYGIGVHPDYRRIGIAGIMAKKAMEYLRSHDVDVGFLSVDVTREASILLHERQGFVRLPRDYSWTNARGELKQSNGGMIAPIGSKELFEHVLHGSEAFYVGEGYW